MSFNKNKADPILGQQVHAHLLLNDVETPRRDNGLDRKLKIAKIEEKVRDIMTIMGLDLNDDSLAETPTRWAKMVINETMWGLDYDAFPKCTTVKNKMGYDEMIVESGITVQSTCEHHFLPIVGKAVVAYIPNTKVLGLSKLNRVVEFFSKRPQIQERLTEQIYFALQYILETENVAVMIQAEHLCVSSRGVEDTSSFTTTSKLGGGFKSDPSARAEFLALARSFK